MAAPITEKGSYVCQHDGTASPTTSDPRLTLATKKVVLVTGAALFGAYDQCTAPNPPGTCATTAPLPNTGQSSRLTVGGIPVLLDSVQANSLPAGTPLKSVAAGQSVLTAS
jgi:hypothetical protein